MLLAAGSHRLGPDSGSLLVKTYRSGVAARAGHDLVIEVTRWEAIVEVVPDPAEATIELHADPRSLEVREGVGGAKPLTDRDRAEIRKTIDAKVLRGQPISFRSTALRSADGGVVADGELTIRGRARPLSVRLDVGMGRIAGTIALTQSEWGIEPYRGLMGALKVRDQVEVVIDAQLPAG
jgi:polyisoprenoid-binding protein YceI